MDGSDDIRQLLREIRDTQREQLAEYRKVAERSLELQQRAVARQEQIGHFSRRLMVGGGVLVAVLLMLLVYLLARWWRYLFGMLRDPLRRIGLRATLPSLRTPDPASAC